MTSNRRYIAQAAGSIAALAAWAPHDRKTISRRTVRCLIAAALLGASVFASAPAEAGRVVQLINSSGENAATTLNSTGTFVTSFLGTNDVTLTLLSGSMDANYVDTYPPASADSNNPSYISSFVGSTKKGTGDGSAGAFDLLQESAGASLQIDFSDPLLPRDHFLVADVDTTEEYSVKAYTLSGGVYKLVSLTKWTLGAYTGQTGELPNSEWPTWDPTGGGKFTGTLTSNADGANLDEPLDVLTPNRAIYRIVFTEISGNGTPGLQFYGTLPKSTAALSFAPAAAPEPSTWAMALIGFVGLGFARYRASQKHAAMAA
jgi:hypothetical protein